MRDTPLAIDQVDHVVITRFSAVLIPDQAPAAPEWLDYRLGFFIDACLPSMLSQTTRDFRWLVWFDDRCPDDFRADVEDLARGSFEPVWTHTPFTADLRPRLQELASRPWLLTTRHDSDDALARDFIAAVHAELRPMDPLVIDFPRGLQIDRSGAVYADHLQSNHCASLLEQWGPEEPRTVFVAAHPKLRRHAPIRRVITDPMWLEVVHGSNLSNDIRGHRVAPDVVARRFDLHLGYRQSVAAATLRRERRQQAKRVIAARVTNPHVALAWTRQLGDLARGSHLVAHQPGPSLGERIEQLTSRLR